MSLRIARRLDGVERTLIRRIFDSAPADAINLGLGQPDLATPDFAAEDGIAAIRAGKTGYTTTAGDPVLRAAIAARYPEFVSGADCVVVTVGSQQAIFAACMALLDPGDELLIPEPGYPAYPNLARLLGATPRSYPLRPENGFTIDPADIAPLLTPRTRAMVVCEPSNPTGAYTDRNRLCELSALLDRHGVSWIADEIYSAFDYDGAFCSMSTINRAGLVVSSLSKDLAMTGWRLGWVAGPAEAIARITAIQQTMVTCAPAVSQAAAARAFGSEGDAVRARRLERFRRRRNVVSEELAAIPGLGGSEPRGSFYYFVDVSRYGDGRAVAARILEHEKVIVIPGAAFGTTTDGYIRISFALDEVPLRDAMRRIARRIAAPDV